MVVCCGKTLSDTGSKFIFWGWTGVTSIDLLIGIILVAVNKSVNKSVNNFVYQAGVLMLLSGIVSLILLICYGCNVWGMKDPGCCRCGSWCGGYQELQL